MLATLLISVYKYVRCRIKHTYLHVSKYISYELLVFKQRRRRRRRTRDHGGIVEFTVGLSPDHTRQRKDGGKRVNKKGEGGGGDGGRGYVFKFIQLRVLGCIRCLLAHSSNLNPIFLFSYDVALRHSFYFSLSLHSLQSSSVRQFVPFIPSLCRSMS